MKKLLTLLFVLTMTFAVNAQIKSFYTHTILKQDNVTGKQSEYESIANILYDVDNSKIAIIGGFQESVVFTIDRIYKDEKGSTNIEGRGYDEDGSRCLIIISKTKYGVVIYIHYNNYSFAYLCR